ncbi:MAG: hypothetical protein H6R10_2531 [Rhodocyclaceae bacterium]|nr:hypothetical protein [Rhodocyclaceae bacterium]
MAGYREKKIELAVAAIILALLSILLLGALERAQRSMEEAMVQAEAGALRVELLDRLSHREAFGGKLPEGRNPVVWAGRAPSGYVGEVDAPPAERGIWYFERRSGVLAYRFRHGGEARFRLAFMSASRDVPAVLAGVGLVRLENVRDR